MSKVVTVHDFLIAKDPDKYKKMFEGKAENEKEKIAKQEAVETLPNENRELLREVQRLENEINALAKEKSGLQKKYDTLMKVDAKLLESHDKQEGYIKDLKKIISDNKIVLPDDQSEGDDKKEDKKKSKRELERERK